jgi:hypothetical protein
MRQAISGFHWERMDRRKGHKLTLSCNYERADELFVLLHYCPDFNGPAKSVDEAVSTLLSWEFSTVVMHLFMEYGTQRTNKVLDFFSFFLTTNWRTL